MCNTNLEIAVVLEEHQAVLQAHQFCLVATGTKYLQYVRKPIPKTVDIIPPTSKRVNSEPSLTVSNLHAEVRC